jgi:hypothetical protein
MDALTDMTLALIAIAALVAVGLAVRLAHREGEQVDDPSYRAGLDASAEISALAFEAEHLMYVAAEEARREQRNADAEGGG